MKYNYGINYFYVTILGHPNKFGKKFIHDITAICNNPSFTSDAFNDLIAIFKGITFSVINETMESFSKESKNFKICGCLILFIFYHYWYFSRDRLTCIPFLA